MFKKFVLPGLGVILMVFAIYHVVRAQQTPGKTSPHVAPATSPFIHTIAGAGVVEAETENIAIGSHHPGVVMEVLVKVGDKVEKNRTPLFRLDDRQLRAELAVRKANLSAAETQLTRLQNMPRKEEVDSAKARVEEAEARRVDAKFQYDQIADKGEDAFSKYEFVQRKQALASATALVAKAKADLELTLDGAWKYDKQVAQAAVEQSRALVEQTQTELSRLEVRASITGDVLQVNVRPGEFVATPAAQALVVLGGTRKHIRVDVDENDITRFRTGMQACAIRRGDAATQIPLRFVRVEPMVVPKKSLVGGTMERVDTRVLQVVYAVESTDVPL
jgi:multidrug resistance efflux pump